MSNLTSLDKRNCFTNMQDTPNKTLQHTTLNDDISPTMLSKEEKRELKERI